MEMAEVMNYMTRKIRVCRLWDMSAEWPGERMLRIVSYLLFY